MKLNRTPFKLLLAVFAFAALGASALCRAGEVEQQLTKDFPPQSIATVERANAALKLVPAARAEIRERTRLERADCLQRFLTSSCLADVRNREHQASKAVRRVEVEANALLRRERAAERDRAVAEREKRAAEQRAKAIDITGAARESDAAEPATDADDADDAGR